MNQFARPGLAVTELPPVNADDNGKVLGVSDGAWAKVAASGGSDLPDDPAQDGTYNLQNTVSSGTSTLSWASGSSGGGVLVVHATGATYECDKTAGEMLTAFSKGPVIITSGGHYEAVLSCLVEGTSYTFTTLENEYKASSADGYPSIY